MIQIITSFFNNKIHLMIKIRMVDIILFAVLVQVFSSLQQTKKRISFIHTSIKHNDT